MMSLDCTLAVHHKKEEYIWMEIGGDLFIFFVLELWSIRLYQGASLCTFFFGSWCIYFDVFIFYELYMIRGDIMFLFLFLVSHCATLIIDLFLWGYSWYISFILCYVKSRIYFVLLVFSTHVFMCLLSVTGIYRLI